MTIRTLGNSSTATVPTLLDLILKNKMEDHAIEPGDHIILTSVGAGMVINSIVYRFPENYVPLKLVEQTSNSLTLLL